MLQLLLFLVIGIVVALLFLNIYFRVKVLKYYKILVQNEVEFDTSHMLNAEKMRSEVLPKYPEFSSEIDAFCGNIRYSLKIASILVAFITIFGAILMYYK